MSTALARAEHDTGNGAAVIRPQSVGTAAEQQRAVAEIQAALTVAKHSRRDEVEAVDRIKNACQRIGLAEKSEYVYNRGGTDITGPTIDLLTVIANYWGNIQFGFRELSQQNGESTVEAFAWDLESNAKRSVVFTVAHKRVSKRGTTALTDPRDVYELVANYAQRRVRSCLEAIVPPDVVEDAVLQCRATLQEQAEVTPDAIAKLLGAFGKISVTREQIEGRIGRRLDAMQPAQLVSMRRIYKSIQDGMSKPEDWFAVETVEGEVKPAAERAKDALRKRAADDETHDRPDNTPDVNQDLIDLARQDFAVATDATGVDFALAELAKHEQCNEPTRTALEGMAADRKKAIAEFEGRPKKGQKAFA
jgi:hypothetical protein